MAAEMFDTKIAHLIIQGCKHIRAPRVWPEDSRMVSAQTINLRVDEILRAWSNTRRWPQSKGYVLFRRSGIIVPESGIVELRESGAPLADQDPDLKHLLPIGALVKPSGDRRHRPFERQDTGFFKVADIRVLLMTSSLICSVPAALSYIAVHGFVHLYIRTTLSFKARNNSYRKRDLDSNAMLNVGNWAAPAEKTKFCPGYASLGTAQDGNAAEDGSAFVWRVNNLEQVPVEGLSSVKIGPAAAAFFLPSSAARLFFLGHQSQDWTGATDYTPAHVCSCPFKVSTTADKSASDPPQCLLRTGRYAQIRYVGSAPTTLPAHHRHRICALYETGDTTAPPTRRNRVSHVFPPGLPLPARAQTGCGWVWVESRICWLGLGGVNGAGVRGGSWHARRSAACEGTILLRLVESSATRLPAEGEVYANAWVRVRVLSTSLL
ncbi:hypothetical protein B0H14DRAFT_3141338 [Mycena olivaceomarginata]|nr:hypothetical protein B0H14DRAFT_3141338 [Mycena olivaceomarginata]